MYQVRVATADYSALGFSLKPPKWLRNAVGTIVNTVTGGAGVQVQTPPIVIQAGGGTSVAARPATTGETITNAAGATDSWVKQNIPGGWVTVGVGSAVALALILRATSRRR